MNFLSLHKNTVRYGALIVIDSGGVAAMIVRSDPTESHAKIIWATRKAVPLKLELDTEQGKKHLMESLINAVLSIDKVGHKTLKQFHPRAKITTIQISISAPWSFTLSKNIEYNQETAITITPELVTELVTKVKKQTINGCNEIELVNNCKITFIAGTITGIKANGYKLSNVMGRQVRQITLTYVSTLLQSFIASALLDLKAKILPQSTLSTISYMMMFYGVVKDLYPNSYEYCLVNITYEATELAVVSGGVLQYCTFAKVGINTLARNFSQQLNIPHEEALAFLREPTYSTNLTHFPQTKRVKTKKILDEYVDDLVELFSKTGDALSIPHTIYVHGNSLANAVIRQQVTNAAKISIHSTPTVFEITAEILTNNSTTEKKSTLQLTMPQSSILLAAHFFHKSQPWDSILK